MKQLFRNTCICFLLLAGIAVILIFFDRRPNEIIRKEVELNESIKRAVAGLTTVGRQVKVSELYPYQWDYVCFVDQMTTGAKSILTSDLLNLNVKASNDLQLSDDERGLTFFSRASKSLVTHVINFRILSTLYMSASNSNCINREDAYVKAIIEAPESIHLNLFKKGDR